MPICKYDYVLSNVSIIWLGYVGELVAYAERKWRDIKHLPSEVLERARQHIAAGGGRCRICIRYVIHIAVYRKEESPAD